MDVEEYEAEDLGVALPQSYEAILDSSDTEEEEGTPSFDDHFLGVGSSAYEALQDALEQASLGGYDVSTFEEEVLADFEGKSDPDVEGEEVHYLRLKLRSTSNGDTVEDSSENFDLDQFVASAGSAQDGQCVSCDKSLDASAGPLCESCTEFADTLGEREAGLGEDPTAEYPEMGQDPHPVNDNNSMLTESLAGSEEDKCRDCGNPLEGDEEVLCSMCLSRYDDTRYPLDEDLAKQGEVEMGSKIGGWEKGTYEDFDALPDEVDLDSEDLDPEDLQALLDMEDNPYDDGFDSFDEDMGDLDGDDGYDLRDMTDTASAQAQPARTQRDYSAAAKPAPAPKKVVAPAPAPKKAATPATKTASLVETLASRFVRRK